MWREVREGMVSDRVWFLEGFGDWVMRGMGDRVILKTEMAEGESAAVIGPTRHPASRVASSYRCNRCEPESLVEPSTTPSSSLSIPVSRLKTSENQKIHKALSFTSLKFLSRHGHD